MTTRGKAGVGQPPSLVVLNFQLSFSILSTTHPPTKLYNIDLWQDMINCVGGLPILFPILEQLAFVTPDQQMNDPTAGSDFITPDVTTPADGDWVILPSNRSSGLF